MVVPFSSCPIGAAFWARRDQTPFGAGRPFSSGQLRKLLRRTGFVQGQSRATLILPPQMPERLMRSLSWLRTTGHAFAAAIGRRMVDGSGEKSAGPDRFQNGFALSLNGGYPPGFIAAQPRRSKIETTER